MTTGLVVSLGLWKLKNMVSNGMIEVVLIGYDGMDCY
jgi:hypothetical protein